ncbi:unnamed protein product, partial [Linum tenue]
GISRSAPFKPPTALNRDVSLCLTFFSDVCLIQDMQLRRMTGSAKLSHGLYHLEQPVDTSQPKHFSAATSQDFDVWHFRLGHVSHSKVPLLKNLCLDIDTNSSIPCDTCHFARQKRLPFPSSTSVAQQSFELIHVDIWGPNPIPSYDGFKYFLTIVDDFTRMTWLILLPAKSDARPKLQAFCSYVERQFQTTVKRIRSDQGREFEMTEFFNRTGILHELSCVETPQQNSRVERKHQHILAVARALKFQSNLSPSFWSDCVKHSVFLINRVPTIVLGNQTPFQKLYNKPPDLSDLKVFGCLCFASTLANHRSKFDSRARKGVFLGFQPGMKGYKIYDLLTHDIFVSRDVQFYEHVFPFKDQSQNQNQTSPYANPIDPT